MVLSAALNQFTKTLDKNQAESLFKLLLKYRPETKTEKRERLVAEAEARADNKVRTPRFMLKHINLPCGCTSVQCAAREIPEARLWAVS